MSDISVLIVEDESLIAHDIATSVESFGYRVAKLCTDGYEALAYFDSGYTPSIVLMDINLDSSPNGIQTAKMIKTKRDIPLIYLTAFVDKETIQKAVEVDPIGYLTKPFSQAQLQAALQIAVKQLNIQKSNQPKGDIILDKHFSYDREGMQLIRDGEFIKLTKKETQLLQLLIHRKNQIVPFDVIESELWPDKEPNENTVRALVSRLRAKLDNRHIETLIGMGYKLQI